MNKLSAYLGDGVYASFDGWQIWLAANHHENNVIALDPDVFEQLIQYSKTLKKRQEASLPAYSQDQLGQSSGS
jgi:hypothetical protein